MCTNLFAANESASSPPNQALAGTLVSSLHRLKDIDNTGMRQDFRALQFLYCRSITTDMFFVSFEISDGGFFVFGDLSVKVEGEFRLRFSLFEMQKYGLSSLLSTFFVVVEEPN